MKAEEVFSKINDLNEYKKELQAKINYLETKINNEPRINLKEVVFYFISIIIGVVACTISSYYVIKNPYAALALLAPLIYFSSYLPKYINSISKEYTDETKRIKYINKLSKKLINELINNKEYIDILIEELYENLESSSINDREVDTTIVNKSLEDLKILKKVKKNG